jgi:Zn-dependent protease with chaperone function
MTISEMEQQPLFRRTVWTRNLFLFLALALNLAVLAFLAALHIDTQKHENEIPILGFYVQLDRVLSWSTVLRFGLYMLIQIGFAHWVLYRALSSKEMVQLYPEDKSKGQKFGTLTGPQLVALVQELAQSLGVSKVARIAVARKPDPNAFTAWVTGLGNVVVLHSNLLEILPRDGVRSVIAHEIGHIRRGDSILYQLLGMPRMLAYVLVLLTFAKLVGGLFDSDGLAQFFTRVVFLCLIFWLIGKLFTWMGRIANLASQRTELIVDGYAAQTCGWENHLNALLLMGDRADVLTGFIEVLNKVVRRANDELGEKAVLRLLNRLPPRELDRQKAIEAAPLLYIVDRLNMLRKRLCVPLGDVQINELATQAAQTLGQIDLDKPPRDEFTEGEEEETATDVAEDARKKAEEDVERQKKEEEIRKNLLHWRDYDRDRSGHIDAQEVVELVRDLRQHPNKMISRQFFEPEALWQDHPTIRDRILFIYDLFSSPQTAAKGTGAP